jgi:hypothetical protein
VSFYVKILAQEGIFSLKHCSVLLNLYLTGKAEAGSAGEQPVKE